MVLPINDNLFKIRKTPIRGAITAIIFPIKKALCINEYVKISGINVTTIYMLMLRNYPFLTTNLTMEFFWFKIFTIMKKNILIIKTGYFIGLFTNHMNIM